MGRLAVLVATLLGSLGIALPSFADSAGPAPVRAAAKALHAESFRLAPQAARSVALQLNALDSAVIESVKRANAGARHKRLEIGVGRALDDAFDTRSAVLQWTPIAGGRAAHWKVSARGARALRVELAAERFPAGAELRFAGSLQMETVYGPVMANDILAAGETYWSPVLEGDTATIEVFLPDIVPVESLSLSIPRLSHLFVSPADPQAQKLAKIGESQFCEIDLICRSASDSTLEQTGRSVARMTFSNSGGSTFFCTGTLLNAADGSGTPYFYSAAHCFTAQSVASTLNTHWFYEAAVCNSFSVNPAYVQIGGGATVLHADTSSDALFLRLNNSPPSGAILAGWDSTAVASGVPVTAIHHPAGDLKKVSLGSTGGFTSSPLASGSFIRVNWNSVATGVTEGGSSGSGIFSRDSSGMYFRGGLLGGPSSCSASASELFDVYSRFDQVYSFIRQYLNPASSAAPNYTALWWNPAESGWGINITHQGDILFATLFTYDSSGQPLWLVMSSGNRQGTSDTYSGALYRTTGPAFNAVPFTPINAGNLTQVGTMTLSFAGPNAGGLSYSVSGVNVTKQIQRQVYGSRAATCAATTSSRVSATNYQDLWWNPAESGWGINLTHQDNIIFATLFTYSSSGQGNANPGLWLVMSAGVRQSDGSYFGELYRTTGPAFNAVPFTPIGPGNITQVGTMRLRFSNGENGTLEYTVNGVPVTKAITRQVFATPGLVCSS